MADRENFISAVQNGDVRQPTQRQFSLSDWSAAFSALTDGSEIDARLHEAGIWFYRRLSTVRERLLDFPQIPEDRALWIKMYVGSCNRDQIVLNEAIVKNFGDNPDVPAPIAELCNPELPPGPDDMNMDGIGTLEREVSALRYALSELPQSDTRNTVSEKPEPEAIIGAVRARLNLAAQYDGLSDLWLECLWNRWQLDAHDDVDILRPSSLINNAPRTLSIHRNKMLLSEFAWNVNAQWHTLPKAIRDQEASRHRVVNISDCDTPSKLVLGPASTDHPPARLAMQLVAEEIYWNDLLIEPLPSISNVNIRDILQAWEVISSFGQVALDALPTDTGVFDPERLLQYAPCFSYADLQSAIHRATDMDLAAIESIIDLFVFDFSPRTDPWYCPLIPISPDEFCPILSALTIPNLIRLIEFWMKRSGIDLGERGPAFENLVRHQLREDLNESRVLSGSSLTNSAVTITSDDGTESEEIDLLWKFGDTLVVFEIKCSLFPSGPLEWSHLSALIEEAAQQAKRKADFVRRNLKSLSSQLTECEGLEPATAQVIPLVLLNRAIGAGVPLDGVPIADPFVLSNFVSGQMDFGVVISSSGQEPPQKTVVFYEELAGAEHEFFNFVSAYPPLMIAAKAIVTESQPLLQISPDSRPVIVETWGIDPKRLTVDSVTRR